jgi:ABC-type antimicrobial peptide transport system ATPase subunit
LLAPPSGCRFHPRCPYAFERCALDTPPLVSTAGGDHSEACFLTDAVKQRGPAGFAERVQELGA